MIIETPMDLVYNFLPGYPDTERGEQIRHGMGKKDFFLQYLCKCQFS